MVLECHREQELLARSYWLEDLFGVELHPQKIYLGV